MEYIFPNELEMAYEKVENWNSFRYSSLQDFITSTTIAHTPKRIRQYISLYLFEESCNPNVYGFLQHVLKKSDEDLSVYRIVTDGSFRRNYTLIRPSIKNIQTYDKKSDSPYFFLRLAKDENKKKPTNAREGLQMIQQNIHESEQEKTTWENRFIEKIINPLLEDLSIAIEKEDEEAKEKIKKQLHIYY